MDSPHRRRIAVVLLAALVSAQIGVSTALAGGSVSTNRIATQPTFARPALQPQPPHASLRDKTTKPAASFLLPLDGIKGESQDDSHKNHIQIDSW